MEHTFWEVAPSPEACGVPSGAILRLITELEETAQTMHGFLIVAGGRVAAEGYWAPFHKDRLHRLYSVTKSVVSLAVGRLADEGRLSLADRAADFFPEKMPDAPHPYLLDTKSGYCPTMAFFSMAWAANSHFVTPKRI